MTRNSIRPLGGWCGWLTVLIGLLIAFSITFVSIKPADATNSIRSIEAEKMIGRGRVFSDSTASEHKARLFDRNRGASKSVRGKINEVTVRARGTRCKGAPRLAVTVDGRQVMTRLVRNTRAWRLYSTSLKKSSRGEHRVRTKFTNNRTTRKCDRDLRVDLVKLSFSSKSTQESASSKQPHKVFAHYMLHAYAYGPTVEDYKKEIQVAQSAGIDGFALDIGKDWTENSTSKLKADNLFEAARQLGTGFKLFFSADMNGHSNPTPASTIRDMVSRYYNHPNYYRYEGKPLLSTYGGQDVTFGHATAAEGWKQEVLNPLADAGKPVSFIPHFWPISGVGGGCPDSAQINDLYDTFPYVDGLFYFQGFARGTEGVACAVKSEQTYTQVSAQRGKTFIASVHPTYSAHVMRSAGQVNNSINGDVSGAEGMQQLWQGIIENNIPMVEIVTWNDHLESTYVAPTGVQGEVKGTARFPHDAYRELMKYYINWYKSGVKPTITQDKVFYFYRPHSKYATATDDPLGKPEYWDTVKDNIYVTTMLTKPATVRVISGNSAKNFEVPAGISNISMPFKQGDQTVKLVRNGSVVASSTGELPIDNTISEYNFNYYSNFFSVS